MMLLQSYLDEPIEHVRGTLVVRVGADEHPLHHQVRDEDCLRQCFFVDTE